LQDAMAAPGDLVEEAARIGQSAVALTDHGNLSGAYKFATACEKHDVKPILGCEFYVVPDVKKKSKKRWHLTVLAKNGTGWQNLLRLSTLSFRPECFYYMPRIDSAMLLNHRDGLMVLSGCGASELAQILLGSYQEAREKAFTWKASFGEDYCLEVPAVERTATTEYIPDMFRLSEETGIPVVITGDVHYLRPEEWEAHSYLTKIRGHGKWGWSSREVWLKSADEIFGTFERQWQGSGIRKGAVLQAMDETVRVAEKIETYSIVPQHEISQILLQK
jgi:DNA polymerase-3 subunit alpha